MSTPVADLYAIPYSPWSIRVVWAVEHCGVPVRTRTYLPRVGELALRVRTGVWKERITVPVWVAPGEVITDGRSIARKVSTLADPGVDPLFPEQGLPAITTWEALSDRMLAAGRRLTTRKVLQDPAALRESLAGTIPGGGLLPTVVARNTASWLLRKYGDLDEAQDDEVIIEEGLGELRAALAEGAGKFLVGDTLTWADLCMAVSLQFVSPPQTLAGTIGQAAWPHWHIPRLAESYSDVLAWRDRRVGERTPSPC